MRRNTLYSPQKSEASVSIVSRLSIPLVAVLVAASGLVAQQQNPIPAGVYEFVPAQSDEIEGRIKDAASHMNFLIRGIAERRLRGANQPIDRIDLRYQGDTVWISLREDEPWIASLRTGEFGPYTRADGEVVQVRTQLKPRVIDQYFRSEDGEKQMIYTLRNDGLLAVESIIYSEKLREPFRYTWVYRPVKQ